MINKLATSAERAVERIDREFFGVNLTDNKLEEMAAIIEEEQAVERAAWKQEHVKNLNLLGSCQDERNLSLVSLRRICQMLHDKDIADLAEESWTFGQTWGIVQPYFAAWEQRQAQLLESLDEIGRCFFDFHSSIEDGCSAERAASEKREAQLVDAEATIGSIGEWLTQCNLTDEPYFEMASMEVREYQKSYPAPAAPTPPTGDLGMPR